MHASRPSWFFCAGSNRDQCTRVYGGRALGARPLSRLRLSEVGGGGLRPAPLSVGSRGIALAEAEAAIGGPPRSEHVPRRLSSVRRGLGGLACR